MESVDLETREGVSYTVVSTRYVCDYDVDVVMCCLKYSMSTNAIVSGSHVEPFRQMSTTTALSQWNRIICLVQR